MNGKERGKLQEIRKLEAEIIYASPRRAAILAKALARLKTGTWKG